MAKRYQISLALNNSQFDASMAKALSTMTKMETSAKRLAQALQQMMSQVGAAGNNLPNLGGGGGGSGGGGGGGGGGGSAASSAASLARQRSAALMKEYNDQERARRALARQQAGANESEMRAQEQARRSLARQQARAVQSELTAKDRATKKTLTDEQIALAVHNARVDKLNRQRLTAARESAGLEGESWAAAAASASGLETVLTKVGVVMLGMSAGKMVLDGITSALVDAKDASSRMAQDLIRTNLALREIISNTGKAPGGTEALKQHFDVRKASGLDEGRAVNFVEAMTNTLGTVTNEQFPESQRNELQIRGAKFASVKGGDASTVKARGKMIGSLAGFIRPGGRSPTAREVVGVADRVDALLARGSASQEVMTTQFQKAMSALVDPTGELKGMSDDPLEIAALTSVASIFGDDMYDSVSQVIREVSKTWKTSKKKGVLTSQGKYLEQAGVKDSDKPLVKMEKVFDAVDKNLKPEESVKSHLAAHGFTNDQANMKFQQFYLQRRKGLYKDIMKDAKGAVDPGKPERDFAQFAADPLSGKYLIAQQNLAAAEAARGEKHKEFESAKLNAQAAITGDDSLLTSTTDFFRSLFTRGKMTGQAVRVETEAARQANAVTGRKDAVGAAAAGPVMGAFYEAMSALGGSNESRVNEAAEVQRRQLEEQRKTNELLRQRNGPEAVPPAVPARPAPRAGAAVP